MLVVLSHLGLGRVVPGLFGVTIFFFISGFLITRQLLAELAARGRIDLGRFYIRRMLRLYPALLLAIAAGGAVFVAIGGSIGVRDLLAAIFYVANYRELAGGFQSGVAGVPHPYGLFWSLAVEEHYYLVYPVIVLALGRDRLRLAAVLVLAVAVVTMWRFHIAAHCAVPGADCLAGGDERRLLHATDTRVDSILYGALLATLLGSRCAGRLVRMLVSTGSLIAGLALLALSIAVRDDWFRDTLRFSVQGIGLFLVVGNILFGARITMLRQVLSGGVAGALGRWSYSLYLWHWLVLIAALAILPRAMREPAHQGGLSPGQWVAFALPVAAISLLAAYGSYAWVERPILGLRRRFGAHHAEPAV